MPTKLIKNAYNAGKLSQYMDGRTDLNKYYNGMSIGINVLILPHGGFTKRPGTIYKATSPTRANLTPFEFSVGDALILEWSNALLRFYKDQAIVNKPYGTEDLSDFDSATGDSSLVAHWLFNDNLATQAVLDDTVAGNHDGTMAGATNTEDVTTADESGTANKAFDLNNTDYVTVGDHANLSFGDGATDSPFTFIAWIYEPTGSSNGLIMSKNLVAGGNQEWTFAVIGGVLQLDIHDDSASKKVRSRSDDALSVGWHLVGVSYNGSVTASAAAGNDASLVGMKFYIDRVPVTASVVANEAGYVAMENLTSDVELGSENGGNNIYTDKMHNIAIFNRILSDVEIAGLSGSDSTTAYSIISPYTTAQAFEIHYTQSADVMYIAHEDVHPKKLSRLGDTVWTINDVDFKGGPFLVENTTEASLLGFARTGGVAMSGYYFPKGCIGTLTATGNHYPFNVNQIGAKWLIKHTRPDNTTSTFDNDANTAPTDLSAAVKCKGGFTLDLSVFGANDKARLWRKAGNGSWQEFRSFTSAIAFSATEDADDVYYAMSRNVGTILGTFTAKDQINYGIVKITAFTSSAVVTVEVIDPVLSNNTNDNAVTTSLWAEGAWSTYRGFPRTVGFHEDRLWWASSTNDPDKKWSSQTSDYESMAYTTGLDNESVTAIVKDNEVSQIQWIMSRRVMAIGAANREYSLSAQNPEDPITPLDKKSIPQTGFSSGTIQPVMLNDSIFFLQRSGKKLGAMKFDSVTENFVVDDATLLAYGLLDSAPTNMAVSRSPDSMIWVVRTDGVMPTFTYEPKEEVQGWGEQIFGNSAAVETPTGVVESVAVIHGTSEDEIWVNVRRVINSSTVYYTELFAPRLWGSDIEDAKFVDSLVTQDGASTDTVTGLSHLEGETVAVFGDGEVQATKVVASGQITAATAASVFQVGLPYTMKARSMRLAVPSHPSALQTLIKNVKSVTVRYIRSLLGSAGVEYGGTEYLTDINAAYSTESADTDKQYRLIQGGFNEDAYITIVSDDPVPFTALSTVIEVEI